MTELAASPAHAPQLIERPDQMLIFHAHAVRLSMMSLYQEQLDETVFTRAPVGYDEKKARQFRRLLKSSDAYRALSIFWKESPYLDDKILADGGVSRSYPNGSLIVHRLAIDLSDKPGQVARLNSRFRAIALAAEAYRLVVRTQVHSTKVTLQGTPILHDFMYELGEKYLLRMCQLIPSLLPILSAPATDERR